MEMIKSLFQKSWYQVNKLAMDDQSDSDEKSGIVINA